LDVSDLAEEGSGKVLTLSLHETERRSTMYVNVFKWVLIIF
jgi:hypothetical protein